MATATGTKIPGIGHLSKKEMYIGGGAAILVIGIGLYRSHQNSKAAAAAAASTTSSTGTTTTDPTTGLPAGSPEDIAALEGQTQYANATDYGYASGGYYDTSTPGGVSTGFTSNSQWSQAAQEYLTNYSDADAATVSAALGVYLTGSYATSAQQQIIEQAIAFEGAPPQSGTNGYPPSINTTPPATKPVITPGPPGSGNPPVGTLPQPAGKPGPGLPPVGTQIFPPAEVKTGFNIPQIASRYGISTAHLLQFNPGIPNPAPMGTQVRVPYQIKAGETLQSVANDFGISIEHLQEFLPTSA